MILLDPDLDPGPARSRRTALAANGARHTPTQSPAPIPSIQTLKRFLAKAQSAVGIHGHVTVLLTTDAAIRKLNRRFRANNKPTDVLSFPADTSVQTQQRGDLAISVDTARRQAARHAHSLQNELRILILHGLLHLAGFDHESDKGRMARQERKLRTKLGLPQGLIERAMVPSGAEASASKKSSDVRAKARTLQAGSHLIRRRKGVNP